MTNLITLFNILFTSLIFILLAISTYNNKTMLNRINKRLKKRFLLIDKDIINRKFVKVEYIDGSIYCHSEN